MPRSGCSALHGVNLNYKKRMLRKYDKNAISQSQKRSVSNAPKQVLSISQSLIINSVEY